MLRSTEDNEIKKWTVLGRDLWPEAFLDHVWTGTYVDGEPIRDKCTAVGFKSFPDHWLDAHNEPVWQKVIMEDPRIKKVIMHREDELAVYVSMMRAEKTGRYMTIPYPGDLKLRIDPVRFQIFVNNYRDAFQRKYKSPMEKQDRFRVTYEQVVTEDHHFESEILPLLGDCLGVDNTVPLKKLRETIKQATTHEDLSQVIENYRELEYCFRHTDVLHFAQRGDGSSITTTSHFTVTNQTDDQQNEPSSSYNVSSWSLLIPICSRCKVKEVPSVLGSVEESGFNSNRFIDLSMSSQHCSAKEGHHEDDCWVLLSAFATSLHATASPDQLKETECVVGIDLDDPVYRKDGSKERIRKLFRNCKVVFVDIPPSMYGKVCRIWNHLASKASNDFLVLLGDDIKLLDAGWQERVACKFQNISNITGLPLGAACVAVKDMSFPGFPTFPVVHRWHMKHFGDLLPKQFVNQGGDPYLFELYSRFNAAAFEVTCRLENTIGGDDDARYMKYDIHWKGQILTLNLRSVQQKLPLEKRTGICLDVVVPSYRLNNNKILQRIVSIRASIPTYVKFWIVLDNPDPDHIVSVTAMANKVNETQLNIDGNYIVNVVQYGKNHGASYARNIGYNFSTADWVLFIDDDVIPDRGILDAYIGALKRYPEAKVFVGLTELPESMNLWTEMLRACNVMYFYGIADQRLHPPWGVTANLMVRGSRHNHKIQFKGIYPKTGGGEDIDFVFQFKKWYSRDQNGTNVVVGVPGAKAKHPWWNRGNSCYGQIGGWAWGDSLCLSEWPDKTFWTFPNWIEFILFCLLPVALFTNRLSSGLLASLAVALVDHGFKAVEYYRRGRRDGTIFRKIWVSFGAGTIISTQEVVRMWALIRHLSIYYLGRRMDWFDGQANIQVLDIQLRSFFVFAFNMIVSWLFMFRFVQGFDVCSLGRHLD